MTKEKNELIKEAVLFSGKVFLIFIGIVLFILISLGIMYYLFPSYDMSCLNETATKYCSSINMTMVPFSDSLFQDNHFACRDKNQNDERDGYIRVQKVFFLSSEMSACKIKEGFTFKKFK